MIHQHEKAFNDKAQRTEELRLFRLPASEVVILGHLASESTFFFASQGEKQTNKYVDF